MADAPVAENINIPDDDEEDEVAEIEEANFEITIDEVGEEGIRQPSAIVNRVIPEIVTSFAYKFPQGFQKPSSSPTVYLSQIQLKAQLEESDDDFDKRKSYALGRTVIPDRQVTNACTQVY